jgi:hypothetical protein
MRWPKIEKRYVIAAILIVVTLSCIPFNLTVSPKREFVVLNIDDEPIKGALAKQVWYQYSLSSTKEVEVRSDLDGKIIFSRRVVKTNLLALISGAISKIWELKLDANVGSTDTVGVFVEGHNWKWFYDGIGLESGVIRFSEQSKDKKGGQVSILDRQRGGTFFTSKLASYAGF